MCGFLLPLSATCFGVIAAVINTGGSPGNLTPREWHYWVLCMKFIAKEHEALPRWSVTTEGIKLSRWRATKLMKVLNIISCQQPGHRYKKASKEHIEIPIIWIASLLLPSLIRSGAVMWLISGRENAGLIWLLYSICFPVSRLAGRCPFSLIQHWQAKPCRWHGKPGENRLMHCITRIKAVTIPAEISDSYCGDIR